MITLIQLVLVIFLALLIKRAKKVDSISNCIVVLIGGFVTFLSVPMLIQADGLIDVGVQIVAEVLGVYAIIWSIVKMIKGKKKTDTVA